ncbi:MAG: hypothetical protein SH868_14080 [Bythopirellula sp.]|nr:hypothetical protein [Bythopirellula sp.]
MNTREQLRERAEMGKQFGMTLAADAKPDKVTAGKVALLKALLLSADGTATIDDATADLSAEFRDGGKWRGTVCRSLATAGLIRRVDVVQSDRPTRHRGYVTRWRLVDRQQAALFVSRLVASIDVRILSAADLANQKSETPTVGVAGVSEQSTLPVFERKESNHG